MRTRVVGEVTSDPSPRLVELNALHRGGLVAVTRAFFALWRSLRHLPEGDADAVPDGLRRVTAKLYQAVLTGDDIAELLRLDREAEEPSVFKVWPDYTMTAQIDRSVATVKVDAAARTYAARGAGICWAVLDSGVDATHPHFSALELAHDDVTANPPTSLHRDFTDLVVAGASAPATPAASPLTDEMGHGTHVAGIIAGACPPGETARVAEGDEPPSGASGFVSRPPGGPLSGLAPLCELVSLKILCEVDGSWVTSSAAVIAALDYVMTEVNVDRSLLRVHGVNLSIGCPWEASHYAAGCSPLCQVIDDVVSTGVVVVVAAGNSGASGDGTTGSALAELGSILEPAHAESCIAVGSTHRDAPFRFGVSWTSSKGPTLDGRAKPDVVAPGEWITSAATGRIAARAGVGPAPDGSPLGPAYAPQSGTSMAAPHVSGLIAAFLSVRPEFTGRPDDVKRLLLETATDLGRERYAQGSGLPDLIRMLERS